MGYNVNYVELFKEKDHFRWMTGQACFSQSQYPTSKDMQDIMLYVNVRDRDGGHQGNKRVISAELVERFYSKLATMFPVTLYDLGDPVNLATVGGVRYAAALHLPAIKNDTTMTLLALTCMRYITEQHQVAHMADHFWTIYPNEDPYMLLAAASTLYGYDSKNFSGDASGFITEGCGVGGHGLFGWNDREISHFPTLDEIYDRVRNTKECMSLKRVNFVHEDQRWQDKKAQHQCKFENIRALTNNVVDLQRDGKCEAYYDVGSFGDLRGVPADRKFSFNKNPFDQHEHKVVCSWK